MASNYLYKCSVASFIFAILTAFFAAPASALTPLADCAVLSTPGETYQLTVDLDKSTVAGSDYVCFDITAPNVTLDCQNFEFVADEEFAPMFSKGVRISADNAKVINCDSRGWFFGIYSTAGGANISTNNVSNNYYGIYLDTLSSSNLVYNNYLAGNGGNAVDNGDNGANSWNLASVKVGTNIIGGSRLGGNYYDDYTGVYYPAPYPPGIGTTPYDIAGSAGSQDGLPLSNRAFTPCNMSIDLPGTYTLPGDSNCTGGNGITIYSDDVILDCQGFTLTGPGSGYGIYAKAPLGILSNITVQNCNVQGWENGIYFDAVTNSMVDNVNATNNQLGVYFYNVTNSNVTNSNASSNSYEGFSARFSDSITYSADVAQNNSGYTGFYLFATPNARLTNVIASGNGWAQPYGGGYGIELIYADNAVVTNAAVSDQRTALCSTDSPNVLIDGGSFVSAEKVGILNGEICYFDDPAMDQCNGIRCPWAGWPTNFTVQNAYIFSPDTGIYNSHRVGSLIATANTLAGNATGATFGCGGDCMNAAIVDRGDNLAFSTGAIINGNTISGFSHGIEILSNGSVTNNVINVAGQALSNGECNLVDAGGNTQNGNPVFWSNTSGTNVTGGTYAEIDLCGANGSTINGATVTNGGGIFLDRSPGSTVSANTVSNVVYGISLSLTPKSIVDGNTITTAGGGIVLMLRSSESNITNNEVRDIYWGTPPTTAPTAALWIGDGTNSTIVSYNTFADSDNGVYVDGETLNGVVENTLISFNTIQNNSGHGIVVGSAWSLAKTTSILNNTICNNTLGGVDSTYSTGTTVANNTICVSLFAPEDGNITNSSAPGFYANATNILEAATCNLLLNSTNYGVYLTNPPAGNPSYLAVPVADGTYSWTVQCTDADGNNGIAPARTITVDATSPLIFNIDPNPGTRGFKFNWETDEPAESWVEYGLTAAHGSVTPTGTGTNHEQSVTGLGSCKTYHYEIFACDALGNCGSTGDLTAKTRCASGIGGSTGGTGGSTGGTGGTGGGGEVSGETGAGAGEGTQVQVGSFTEQAAPDNKELVLLNTTETYTQPAPETGGAPPKPPEEMFPWKYIGYGLSLLLFLLAIADYYLSRRNRQN